MIEPKVKQCPACGSEKIVVTRLKGMVFVVGQMDRQSAVFAEICIDCGQVVNLMAEHPDKLRGDRVK